jgi:RNA polymerase sigma-70 factor (ECF subfamily)
MLTSPDADAALRPRQPAQPAPPAPPVRCALDSDLSTLMPLIRQGCTRSFAQLYGLTNSRLFGIVLRINASRCEAEEVLQEVYVRVWTERAQFDLERAKVMHWLGAIARHAAIDSLRRRQVRPATQTGWATADTEDDCYALLPSSWPSPFELLARQQGQQAIDGLLAALTDAQRQCLALAYLNGMSHAQIAQQLGQPLGTVKSWLRRAFDTMRPGLAAHR